ncbi:MAG: 7-carboxy-7-deazaguanine synthase QueE [Steroidobacteraceae bacterium]|nr:7-carboxy-7-deazaguanine synthase QueE [Steroidobacteraceae bacterium]MDW8259320.1 7-carboxy-7-deazaguanine synthase QueE [Gammaproteobacteria bacterium]
MRAEAPRLRVTEIFRSLQGEANTVGVPTTFVRLTGCPLRCRYCDTTYAFSGGEWRSLTDIVAAVGAAGNRHVCVTGGEPLAQPNVLPLMRELCDAGFAVSLETSGALPIERVDPRVARVVDMKTPGSGECARNRYENLADLRAHDQVKFVICDRNDYEWSRAIVERYALTERCTVLFGPSAGQILPRTLADWIVDDRLQVRFQIQLHKLLWGDVPGR